MLLFIAFACLGVAAYLVSEVATYPARQKSASLKRATMYGRRRVAGNALEAVRFRERVLVPAVAKLASLALKLNPRATAAGVGHKLLVAGLSARISPSAFLAV